MEGKKLRVWWIRNVPATKDNPIEYHEVASVREATKVFKQLAKADLKNQSVSDNVGGLEVFEGGEWSEYYDEEGRDIDEIWKKT